jgi:hypothetical protein
VVKRQTIQRVATPTALLVGVTEPLAGLCTDTLAQGGLRVLRVGHVAAACERIPVIMPQLVIVSQPLHADELEMLADRCVAVGAAVVEVAPGREADPSLEPMLREAARTALGRSVQRAT